MTLNNGSKDSVEPQNSGSKAAYVPKKGDIVVTGKVLKLITDINEELNTVHYTDFAGIGTVCYGIKGFGENSKLVGLSLARIEAEYLSKDAANIREIQAYELGLTEGYNKWGVDERIKRDEKLLTLIEREVNNPCPDRETLMEGIRKVFASIDSEEKNG